MPKLCNFDGNGMYNGNIVRGNRRRETAKAALRAFKGAENNEA